MKVLYSFFTFILEPVFRCFLNNLIVCYFPFISGFFNYFTSELGLFIGNSPIYPWRGTLYTFLSVLGHHVVFFLDMRDTQTSRHQEFAHAPTFLRRLTTVIAITSSYFIRERNALRTSPRQCSQNSGEI